MFALLGGCGFLHTRVLAQSLGTATPIARAAIARFLSKREIEQRIAKIVYDSGLNKDITDIQKIMDDLSSANPAYIKEFHDFEKLCTDALKKAIEKIPKNVLDYVTLRLNFNKIMSVVYKRVNDTHLESLIDLAIQDANENQLSGIANAGFNAFVLLEQHQVIDNLMGKLVDELHASSFDCYTSAKLVNTIVHEILTQEWQALTETREHTTEEKDKLTSKQEDLYQRTALEKDVKKVKKLKLELCDIFVEINQKDKQLTTLVKQIEEFNTKIRTIDGVAPDTITPVIQFLNERVFRTDTVFEILDIDEKNAKNIFQAIPLHPSLKILRSAYVAAFTHLYDASSKRASILEHSSNAIVEISRTGDGSLIPAFWIKYISKIAAANGLEIKKTIELAKLKITEIDEQQKEEISALESEILGVKTSVPADGDCYFTSVAVSLGLAQDANVTLRQMTIDHIITNRAQYEPLITHSTFDEYIKIYRVRGAWNQTRDGNDIMVPALAKKLGVHMVIHDEMHGGIVQSINGGQEEAPVLHLCYTGTHYIPYIAPNLTPLEPVRDKVINYVSPKEGNDVGLLRSVDTFYAKSRNLLPSVNDMAAKNSSAGPK